MKQLTCEMCGSTDLMKQDGVFVCQTCGCKYSVEEAKKMMVEGTVDVTGSTVKVDVSEKVKNLYVLARRAKDDNNAELAEKYYEMITFEMPNDWEALFYFNYFKAKHTKLGNMENSVISLANSLDSVFALIDKSDKTSEQKWEIAKEIMLRIDMICDSYIDWAKSHHRKFSNVESPSDFMYRVYSVADLQKKMADLLEKHFDNKLTKETVSYLKSYVENYLLLDMKSKALTDTTLHFHYEDLIEAENRIKDLDPEYESLVEKANKEIIELSDKVQNKIASNETQEKDLIQVNYQIGHEGVNGWMTSPNSAGGVSIRYAIKNIGQKEIKYFTFSFVPYNAVGDIVKCRIKNVDEKSVRGIGPIAQNCIKNNHFFENVWYNNSITSVKLVAAVIEYMDGTIEVIKGEQINPIGYSNTTPPQQKSCTVAKIFYILSAILPMISLGIFFAMLVNDNNSAFLFLIMTFVGPIITALIGRVIDELNWNNKK